jgi:hypothetical protein
MKGRVVLILAAVVLIISSCRHSSKNTGSLIYAGNDSTSSASAGSIIDVGTPEEISRTFSSSVEIANLLLGMNVPFSSEYLASSLKASDQMTSFDKALALGVLGADLGYLNMYERTGSSIDLLSSIKKIADGLRVGQFIDFETIKRLSLDKSNLDSLLFLSLNSFSNIDKYFRENGRGQLSSLMMVSGWIESQYFAAMVIRNYPDQRLRDRIGEQEYLISDLIKIIYPYCDQDEDYRKLCGYLYDLRDKYSKVKITYTHGNPVKTEKNGRLIITQTDTSYVDMTDKQLTEINETIINIRNKLIASK